LGHTGETVQVAKFSGFDDEFVIDFPDLLRILGGCVVGLA